jgi:hypothetical protein
MKSFLKNYKKNIVTAFLVVTVAAISTSQATTVPLGTAADFAVLGGSGVTNPGGASTFITGDVGSCPTSTVTNLLPVQVDGTLYLADSSVTDQAHTDLIAAYNAAAAMPVDHVLTGLDLGSTTLTPGVYKYASEATWTAGTLTLDGEGNPDAQWIFQIGSTLITPEAAAVLLINGASANNVFWQVGSSATIGGTNTFAGNILAHDSITLGGGSLNGRALAITALVSIDTGDDHKYSHDRSGTSHVMSAWLRRFEFD